MFLRIFKISILFQKPSNHSSSMQSSAFGFVTYNFSDEFLATLELLLSCNAPCIIQPNTERDYLYIKSFLDSRNQGTGTHQLLTLLPFSGNIGLSKGIRTLINEAYIRDFSHLLYLDQDTLFTIPQAPHNLLKLLASITPFSSYPCIYFSPLDVKPFLDIICSTNSGTAYDTAFFLKHNILPSHFLELIDVHLCLRLRKLRQPVLLIPSSSQLDHSNRDQVTELTFFGLSLKLRLYNSNRLLNICVASFSILYESIISFDFLFIFFLSSLISRLLISQFIFRIGWLLSLKHRTN